MSLTFPTQAVSIDLQDRSYSIAIGADLISQASTFADLPKAAAALIVTNATVAPLYAARLQAALAPHYKTVHQVVLPDGEEFKTWQTLNLIFDALLENNCDRKGSFSTTTESAAGVCGAAKATKGQPKCASKATSNNRIEGIGRECTRWIHS